MRALIRLLDRLFPPTLAQVLATFETTKARLEVLSSRQTSLSANSKAEASDLRARAALIQQRSESEFAIALRADRVIQKLQDFTA